MNQKLKEVVEGTEKRGQRGGKRWLGRVSSASVMRNVLCRGEGREKSKG